MLILLFLKKKKKLCENTVVCPGEGSCSIVCFGRGWGPYQFMQKPRGKLVPNQNLLRTYKSYSEDVSTVKEITGYISYIFWKGLGDG